MASTPFQRVHIDSIPHKPTGVGDKNHAIHITDEASKYRWYIAIKSKLEAFKAVTRWILFMEIQTRLTIREIHVDNGTEFSIEKLKQWCLDNGKKLTTIAPDCPSQNPIVERDGRTIMDGARTANLEAGFGEEFWPLVEEAYIHVLNRLPHRGVAPIDALRTMINLPPDRNG